jgi:uncharacterized protein YjhX (UPF0386 family)
MNMNISLLRSLPLVLLLSFSGSLLAQDDPFGDKSADPFESASSRNASSTVEQQADAKKQIQKLESQLKLTQHKSAEIERQNKALKQGLNSSEERISLLESRLANQLEMHQAIIEQLLNSEKVNDQKIALQHLSSCLSRDGFGKDKMSLDFFKSSIHDRLVSLVDSDDDSVHRLSLRSLFLIAPQTTLEMGYQFGPVWKPTSQGDTPREAKIYTAFKTHSNMEFDDSPLDMILQMLEDQYDFDIEIDKDLDPQMLEGISKPVVDFARSLNSLSKQREFWRIPLR